MATTIQDFFTKAAQDQFSRDFLFRVKQISTVGIDLNGETDLIYARSATYPGRDILNKEANYFGQTFNVSGKSSYPGSDSYSIEFYMDEDGELRRKFEAASRRTFDNNTSTGAYGLAGPDQVMVLEVIGIDLQPREQIRLTGIQIRNIQPVEYAIADGTGEVQKVTCTFSYHFYDLV